MSKVSEAFLTSLKERYPFHHEQLLAALESKEQIVARIRKTATEDQPIFSPLCFRTSETDQQNHEDYFLDVASIFPVAALKIEAGQSVLDLCAAPGGKSLLIGGRLFRHNQKLTSGVKLVANESSRQRVVRLQQNLHTHFSDVKGSYQVICSNPIQASPAGVSRYGPYHAVLIDAPCSSDRHKLAAGELEQWKPSQPKAFAETQLKLLNVGANLVRVGGRMVYSTCALSYEENDKVIEKFLKKSTKFEVSRDFEDFCSDEIKGFPIRFHPMGAPIPAKSSDDEFIILRSTYGYMLLPDLCCGCGPIFLSVLVVKKKVWN